MIEQRCEHGDYFSTCKKCPKPKPVSAVASNDGLCAENAKLRQENIELGRRLFFLGSAFIHYYEDDNGVCKLCRLKQDEVLHKISA